MTRPFLFLDIDGVLNALGGETAWGDTQHFTTGPSWDEQYILSMSQRMADAIMDLECEIIWTTTWRTFAPLVGNLVGIRGTVIPLPPGRSAREPWKRGAVEFFIGNNPRPFLWFEDDPGRWGSCRRRTDKFAVPHHICNTNLFTGITPRDIDNAHSFLASLTQDVTV